MATTTNYGWTTPDDTALVKDGASAIRTLGSSIDTSVKSLNPGTTSGDIDYYTSSTAKARIPKGTAGQVLTMNSGATAPEWTTLLTGSLTLIQNTAASGNSSLSFSSISASYKDLLLVWDGIYHSATGSSFDIRFNNSSSSNYRIRGLLFDNATFNGSVNGTDTVASGTNGISSSAALLGKNVNVTSTDYSYHSSGYLIIRNYASTSLFKNYQSAFAYRNTAGVNTQSNNFFGLFTDTTAITSLDIVRIGGTATFTNATSTSIRLFGVN